MEGLAGSKISKGSSSHKARVSVALPIEGYESFVASVGLDTSSTQQQLSTKFVMGDKKNVITSSLVVATPLTPRDIDVTFKAETPFRGYGAMEVALIHKLMDTALNTKVRLLPRRQRNSSITTHVRIVSDFYFRAEAGQNLFSNGKAVKTKQRIE